MLDPFWLKILCCPESRQGVTVAAPETLDQINQKIMVGEVRNRSGQVVQQPVEAVLIREDGQVGYPVRQGIPVMLLSEALIIGPSQQPVGLKDFRPLD